MKNLKKRIILTTAVLFMAFGSGFAQSGFYAKTFGGYGIAVNKQTMNSYTQEDISKVSGNPFFSPLMPLSDIVLDPVAGLGFEEVHDSYGRGATVGLGIGYSFNERIAVELNGSYLFGEEIQATGNLALQGFRSFLANRVETFWLNPTMVVSFGGEKVVPYLRAGPVVGLGARMYGESDFIFNGDSFRTEERVDGGIPLGFTAAAGVRYRVNDRFSIFGEAEYRGARWRPETRKIELFEINGVDESANFPEQELTDSQLIDGQFTPDVDSPIRNSYVFPLQALNFNGGVRIDF